MVYRLNMFDSGGDGWQLAVCVLQNSSSLAEANEGLVVTSGALSNCSEGFDWLCLADGCYELSVGGGLADPDIGFESLNKVRVLNYDVFLRVLNYDVFF